MKWALHLVAALALAGCNAADPCQGKPGVCIAVHVNGSATMLDELLVAVSGPGGGTLHGNTAVVMPRIDLPVQFALRLPEGTVGKLDVTVAGLQGQAAVAQGTSSVDLPASGHGRVDVLLVPVTGDGGDGGSGGDGSGSGQDGGGDASVVGDGSSGSDGFSASDGGSVTLGPDPLDFGEVSPGFASSGLLTLSNTGPSILISSISLSGDAAFTHIAGGCQPPQSLDTGGSCTIQISFTAGSTPRAASGHVDVAFDSSHLGADLRAHTTGWVSETLVSPSPTPIPSFFSVWGTSPGDVWAAGSGGSLYHRNASGHWASLGVTPLWGTSLPVGVFTPNSSEIYVVSSGLFYSSDGGGSWKQVADAFAGDHAVQVYGFDASTIFAGSDNGRIEIGTAAGGGGFVIDDNSGQPIIGNLFGAGQQAYALAGNQVFKRNGSTLWVSILNESANAVLEGGFAVAPGDFYVAARATSACTPNCGAIYHVSPTAAANPVMVAGTQLNAVWGNHATDLWTVGKGGAIYHSTGNDSWLPEVSSPTTKDLNAIWGNSDELFAVGASATILHHY